MIPKIHGKEVTFCTSCQFPDGEPIMHVMAPGNCERVQEELTVQALADLLRRAYYSMPGSPFRPTSSWKGLDPHTKEAWITVARAARKALA